MRYSLPLLAISFMLIAEVATQAADPQREGRSPSDMRVAGNAHQARYTSDGALMRPKGWRKWIYVGTPLTPHDMNDGKAAFPEFHNVYVDPESFATFERLGTWPNGTQIVKELVLVGSKQAVSGSGYFMGEFSGLEVALKDTERFPDEPGGWVYFSFGHQKDYELTAKAMPTAACNACHEASADTDFVFTQYYPVLRESMPSMKKKAMMEEKAAKTEMDDQAMKAATSAMGETSQSDSSKSYNDRLFGWLSKKSYQQYEGDKTIHPSLAGPKVHGDVRTYLNPKLANSFKAGNTTHPIGSVAVKELYKDDSLIGWVASVKAKEDDGKGNGWYWYENLSTTDGTNPIVYGLGAQMCTGCHAPGNDFLLTKEFK